LVQVGIIFILDPSKFNYNKQKPFNRLSETCLDENEKRKISEIFYGLRKESLADVIESYAEKERML